MSEPTHPDQPLVHDSEGVERFKANSIVRLLLDAGSINLNTLALMPGTSGVYGGAFPREDWRQFAQLIGYSLYGWGTLSYVTDDDWGRVMHANVLTDGTDPDYD